MWLIILSNQLRIFGLVSFYLTNYLILRELISQRSYAFGEGGGFPPLLCGIFNFTSPSLYPLEGVTQEGGREEVK